MADIQPIDGRPALQPTPENDTLNTALLLWHIACRLTVSPSGCWEWPVGPDGAKRYGTVGEGRRVRRVHRLVYELCVGPIPEDVGVLHRCDNPPCCNPTHLFLGSQQDNVDDCRSKGRFVQNKANGGRNGNVKLDEESVRAMRHAAKLEGESNSLYRRLAKAHGVATSTVKGIIKGRSWKHVTDEGASNG